MILSNNNLLERTYNSYYISDLDILINLLINFSKQLSASIKLSLDESWESDSVSCRIDNHKYLLSYYTEDEDDKERKYPRSYHRRIIDPKKIEINGDYYDENMICYDYGLVLMVFKEFFETKTIPLYILS